MTSSSSRSEAIRAKLDHPVIDIDGHSLEFTPLFDDYLREEGGNELVRSFNAVPRGEHWSKPFPWHRMSPEERFHQRVPRPIWWVRPTRNTVDRATAMAPELLRQRMDQFGFDYTIVYPTGGLTLLWEPNDEFRTAGCRAFNRMQADLFQQYTDRMTAAALIPAYTPEEAIAELSHAVKSCGLKVVVVGSMVRRSIPYVQKTAPDAARFAQWSDTLAMDSAYDYDPLWESCQALGVAVTAHSQVHGFGTLNSTSSYVFNHIHKFAHAGEAFCKALVLGGVTRRFPNLNFAFLEGGVAWAASLYSGLVSHWHKRNSQALGAIDPGNLDTDALGRLLREHGGTLLTDREEALVASLQSFAQSHESADELDEWALCGAERPEDFNALFLRNFYFGCEADDPTNAWAFRSPDGVRFKAMFGSDIGHWDVPDMADVLGEAYEMVEKGWIGEEDFRKFVFENPARLHAQMNPDFFKGTVVDQAVSDMQSDRSASS